MQCGEMQQDGLGPSGQLLRRKLHDCSAGATVLEPIQCGELNSISACESTVLLPSQKTTHINYQSYKSKSNYISTCENANYTRSPTQHFKTIDNYESFLRERASATCKCFSIYHSYFCKTSYCSSKLNECPNRDSNPRSSSFDSDALPLDQNAGTRFNLAEGR